MKLLLLVVVVFAGMGLVCQPVAIAEAEIPVEIESISFVQDSGVKETISFKLNASVTPKIFIIRGENPRLVIDFPDSSYAGENVISLDDANLATTIRTGMHREPVEKTRVVVDLSKEITIQYSHTFSEQDNTMVVTLSPDKIDQHSESDVGSAPKEQDQPVLPGQGVVAAVAVNEKPIPPDFSVKEMAEEPQSAPVDVSQTPQLLEISFDDSSNRGEMVLFRLNDFFPPSVSAIEKENPRVLCDFMDMKLVKGVQEDIVANGKYVERIRAEIHQNPDKIQVVLDLSPDRDYDLQQVFFKNDNLFVLIVNELDMEKVAE